MHYIGNVAMVGAHPTFCSIFEHVLELVDSDA